MERRRRRRLKERSEERRKNSSLKSECRPKAPRCLATARGEGIGTDSGWCGGVEREEAARSTGEARGGAGRFIHKTPTVSNGAAPLHAARPARPGAPSGPVLPPLSPSPGGESHYSPRRRGPPVLAYHSSPRRGPPTDNESRNSPGLPARRFLSVFLPCAQRRPNKGIREAADDVGISGASRAPSLSRVLFASRPPPPPSFFPSHHFSSLSPLLARLRRSSPRRRAFE